MNQLKVVLPFSLIFIYELATLQINWLILPKC